jgi:DNA-binding transcriptional regulator YiaG
MLERSYSRSCFTCGEGTIALRNARGLIIPYRDEREVPIDGDVEVHLCDRCGEMMLDEDAALRLDAAQEPAYRRIRVRRAAEAVQGICVALDITQRELERLIGVSDGYVSKLLHGRRVPDATTLRLLHLVRADPQAAVRRIAEIAEIGLVPQAAGT